MFWEKEDDIGLSTVYETLSRKEFEDLKSFIYFADNNALDTSDKFARVRRLYDIMNKNSKQFVFVDTFYSIDKQMIPYTGKNSSKQTIRTNNIRFGYKTFVLRFAYGYP